MDEFVVTRDDASKMFNLAPGGIVAVNLPETPTSGYRWDVRTDDGLRLLSSDYIPSSSSAIGGGGVRVIRVQAVRPSNSRIEATLLRSWEGEASAIDRVQFTIHVSKA